MNQKHFTKAVASVVVEDSFWKPIMEVTRTQMIPYQWKALNDELPDIATASGTSRWRPA